MIVKNTGPKVLGFGKTMLLPGATGELPEGYGKSHPVVAYYFRKGWLEGDAAGGAPEGDAAGGAGPGIELQNKSEDLEKELKAVKNMNKAALQAKAAELGIVIFDTDTNSALIEKIAAALSGGG